MGSYARVYKFFIDLQNDDIFNDKSIFKKLHILLFILILGKIFHKKHMKRIIHSAAKLSVFCYEFFCAVTKKFISLS